MYKLDRIIIRTALAEARRLVSAGLPPEHAAIVACGGAWREFIPQVLAALEPERAARDAHPP